MRNAILHVDRNARVWWCCCQMQNGRETLASRATWERNGVTLEVGHESWDISAAARRAPGHVNGDRKFVTALARGLEVLRAFTPTEGLLGNGEIAERTGLPKPTVSRLTYTLTKLGYLAHVERLGEIPARAGRARARLYGARQYPHPPARAHPHAGARRLCRRGGGARHARPARPDLSGACALQARRDAAPDAGLAPADRHHRDGPRADRRHAGGRARLAARLHQARRKARTGRR